MVFGSLTPRSCPHAASAGLVEQTSVAGGADPRAGLYERVLMLLSCGNAGELDPPRAWGRFDRVPRPLALATSAALVLACVPPPPPAPERVRLPAAADVVEKHAVQILEEQKFDVIEHLSQGRIRL